MTTGYNTRASAAGDAEMWNRKIFLVYGNKVLRPSILICYNTFKSKHQVPPVGGEKGSRVKIPRGSAAVREESCRICHWGNPGRPVWVMTLEPEDLLDDDT